MLAAPLVGFGLITLAWVIDRSDGASETVRNVVLAGRDVGQMNRAELAKVVADLDETLPTTAIRIVTKSFTLETTAGALGIKIDREFTAQLDHPRAAPLIGALTAAAHQMGLRITVEGVETQAQADIVRDLGCDLGQGYLWSRPLPADELEGWLSTAAPASA